MTCVAHPCEFPALWLGQVPTAVLQRRMECEFPALWMLGQVRYDGGAGVGM